MHQHDSRLAKIRKLLAQAEDPAATPEEASAFTAKAAELIAAYGIDAALLEDRAPQGEPSPRPSSSARFWPRSWWWGRRRQVPRPRRRRQLPRRPSAPRFLPPAAG